MRQRYLNEIKKLNPLADHCRIVYLDASYEFPFEIARSLEFALFRSYAVPRISALLRSTGELTKRTRKRYDDTDLLLSEIIQHGYESHRGKAAIDNINRQHAQYPIRNEDFLYVLSTFVFEPIRWIERFGHRSMLKKEQLAWFYFWRAIGTRMGIQAIPLSFTELENYNYHYETKHFRYSQANHDVAKQTIDLLLGFYLPSSLFWLGRPAAYALLDPPLLSALNLPKQSIWLQTLLHYGLRFRGRLNAWLPDRRKAMLRTRLPRPTYPNGYRIDDLGP
ncbi:oxygenase MpaB family protein [Acidihalobacter prosperus]